MIEFPKTVHKAGGKTLTVNDKAGEKEALAQGWHVDPPDQQPAIDESAKSKSAKEK